MLVQREKATLLLTWSVTETTQAWCVFSHRAQPHQHTKSERDVANTLLAHQSPADWSSNIATVL